MSDSDPKQARPSKVTLAASLGAASCFVLIFTLFDTLGRLRGVEMRSEVEDQLAQPPFDTLDVTAEQVLGVMRAVAFVDGALAAAGLVLSVYLFRRHQGARYGFTVVAALLVLTAPVAGLLAFLAAAAAVMLWSEESRAWFAGREPRTRRTREAGASPEGPGGWPFSPGHRHGAGDRGDGSAGAGAVQGPPPVSKPPPPPSGGQPPPYAGTYGESAAAAPGPSTAVVDEPAGAETSPAPGHPLTPVGPYGAPYAPPAGTPTARPGTVTAAAVLTFVGALIGFAMGVALLLGLAADPDAIRDAIRSDPSFESIGWRVDQVVAVLWVCAAVLLAWSVIAGVLGIFVLRRQAWARWTLLVSAAMTALLSLLAILSVVSVIPLLMGVATVVLLLTRSTSRWFVGDSVAPPAPRPGPQQGSGPAGPW